MSTIEKAAERLSARRQATLGTVRKLEPEAASDQNDRPLTRVDSHATGRSRMVKRKPPGSHVCEIDLDQLEARGYLRPGQGRTQLAREMRRIKRPLLLKADRQEVLREKNPDADLGNPANLIMVTSALPGEGKTFVSINLAMSMAAELDREVLLVDADVLKGDVSTQLGIETERGLTDLLFEDQYLAEDGVLLSNVERLSILPAGRNTDHVDELFASDMMATVMRELATAVPDRLVVFDAPPLLPTTEAAVLAQYMGQVVVVVEANRTAQSAVAEAIDEIENRDAISLVLNKSSERSKAGYGYGYGYAYGHPADSEHPGPSYQDEVPREDGVAATARSER